MEPAEEIGTAEVLRNVFMERKIIGVGPGSATERGPSRKIARKWPFFLGGKKIKLPKNNIFLILQGLRVAQAALTERWP